MLQEFIWDYLERTGDNTDVISVTELYQGMRSWYQANYSYSARCPVVKKLRNYLINNISSYRANIDSLVGYRIRIYDMDEIENIDN